jgi:hypothetical protein
MRGKNLVAITLVFGRIPDAFGINHDRRPIFAVVKASRLVDANILKPHFFGAAFHVIAQALAALAGTAAGFMSRRTLVGAAENMGAVKTNSVRHDFLPVAEEDWESP